jgi:lipopolysaccharide/colanic/teichoic acid biosynthesis glycosyltransferase
LEKSLEKIMKDKSDIDKRLQDLQQHRWRLRIRRSSFRFVIWWSHALKRFLDVVVSVVALVILLPLFVVVAVLIKLEDREGPVFYVQTRVGQHGCTFPFPKFRSMVQNADKQKDSLISKNDHGDKGITFKMKDDPRVTRIGKFLRRYSVDEFPQFWSVLVGHMSLVGPRPAVPREVELYTGIQRRRLAIKPGLTCIWQVSGRGDIPFEEQVELDLDYIHEEGFLYDIWLMIKTVPAVLLGKGAY